MNSELTNGFTDEEVTSFEEDIIRGMDIDEGDAYTIVNMRVGRLKRWEKIIFRKKRERERERKWWVHGLFFFFDIFCKV